MKTPEILLVASGPQSGSLGRVLSFIADGFASSFSPGLTLSEIIAQAGIVAATIGAKEPVLPVAAAHALVRRAGSEELFLTH
jgi:hypothetical protein